MPASCSQACPPEPAVPVLPFVAASLLVIALANVAAAVFSLVAL